MSKPYMFPLYFSQFRYSRDYPRLPMPVTCDAGREPPDSPGAHGEQTVSKKTGSRRSWYNALCEQACPNNAPTFSKPGLFP
jgi:hypothetical protein